MSEKERAAALLSLVPQSKLGYVIAYIQGLLADEASGEDGPNAETAAAMNEVLELVKGGNAEAFSGSTADLFTSILTGDN